ncbi:MAG: biopolymer transporter ExbD, partial [Acidobacteria bacterium 13_1_40CM_3_56_11]
MAITTREGKTQTTLAEINMIPFIDIVLVLLIIFMVTAPVIQSGIEVNVPKTQVVREIAEEKLIVSIDKEQKLYLQNDPVNVNELGDKIREKLLDPTRQSVYLRADQSVPFQTFATVLDHLKLAGIENVSIVT